MEELELEGAGPEELELEGAGPEELELEGAGPEELELEDVGLEELEELLEEPPGTISLTPSLFQTAVKEISLFGAWNPCPGL